MAVLHQARKSYFCDGSRAFKVLSADICYRPASDGWAGTEHTRAGCWDGMLICVPEPDEPDLLGPPARRRHRGASLTPFAAVSAATTITTVAHTTPAAAAPGP